MKKSKAKAQVQDIESESEGEKSESEDEEVEPDLRQTLAIFWDVMCNRNLQIWAIYNFFTKAGAAIASNMTQVYLTNDLNFPKETLAMIKVVGMPLNILFAFVSGYLSSERPFIV